MGSQHWLALLLLPRSPEKLLVMLYHLYGNYPNQHPNHIISSLIKKVPYKCTVCVNAESLRLWCIRLIGPGGTWFKLRIRKRASANPASAPSPCSAATRNPTRYRWVSMATPPSRGNSWGKEARCAGRLVRPPVLVLLDRFWFTYRYNLFLEIVFRHQMFSVISCQDAETSSHRKKKNVNNELSSVWDFTSRWLEQGGRWRWTQPRGTPIVPERSLSWWVIST